MTDKQHPDEEYQYPSNEIGTEDSSQKTKADGKSKQTTSQKQQLNIILDKLKSLPFLKNKRVVIVIIAVVVFFLLLKIFGGHPKAVQPVAQKTAQPAAVQITPQQQMDNQIRNLASQILQNKQTLSQIQSNLQQQQNSIQNTNNTIADLSNSVAGLQHKIETMQVAPKTKAAPVKLQTYYIKAIVPGRAWLTNPDNDQVTSVRVGDKLPTYGIIENIDADNGFIMTSSKRPIRYGNNDS